MNFRACLFCGLACFVVGSGTASDSNAQNWYPTHQVYQPGVPYSPIQSNIICNSRGCAQPAPPRCHCGCGGNGRCIDHPNCHMCIRSGKICHGKTTTPIHVDPPKDCETDVFDKKFYCGDYKAKGEVLVPKRVKCTAEKYRFERKKYEICGCCLEICVPCAIDCEVTEECQPVKAQVELVARVRCDSGLVDVWAFGVQGFPSQAVLALKLTKQQANQQFKTTFPF